MDVQLVIAEPDATRRVQWEKAFRDLAGVSIMNAAIRELMARPDLDAVVMTSILAHERFGGVPEVGKSQVLNTKGHPRMPRWVVTTAPAAGRLTETDAGGSRGRALVPVEPLSRAADAYRVFAAALSAIHDFNAHHSEQIRTVGFEPQFLNFDPKPAAEIQGVYRAYVDATRT